MSRIFGVMFVLASGLVCACAADGTNDGPDAANGGNGGTGGTGGVSGGSGGTGGGITGGTTGGALPGGSGGAVTGGSGGALPGGTGGTGGTPGDCMPDDCGPPPPMPAQMCPDGSVAAAECRRLDDGTCGWRMGECPPVGELCSLPLLVGPCEALITSWGFDPEQNDCVEFTYGGCEGNANNFVSREACLAACPPVPDVACGARAGDTCSPAEFCDFGESSCGFDDGEGVCRPRPDACAEIDSPICGCDGRTYSNACLGQVAGVDTLHPGPCQDPPAGECADLSRETIVLSGSLRYGECLEGCNATLTIGATSLNRAPPCDEVQLFVCNNDADGLCTEHGGTLTPVAHDLARRIAADLVGTALMPEYGCPDCADGGASTVELSRQGAHSAHRYETSNPPAELVAADAFVQGLIESLRNCASTENVDVFPGCVPRL
jgi:hypothetical protein